MATRANVCIQRSRNITASASPYHTLTNPLGLDDRALMAMQMTQIKSGALYDDNYHDLLLAVRCTWATITSCGTR